MKSLAKYVVLSCALAGACFGSTSYVFTGTDAAGDAVNAQATFSLVGTSLTLTLESLVTNQKDVGQAISGIQFVLAGLSANPAETGVGTTETVNGAGVATLHNGTSLTGWTASTTLSDVTLTALGGGQPKQTILGPADGSGNYSNANGSIAGNGPHNDFTDQLATFTFTGLTGVNTNLDLTALLSGVQIGFGTVGDDYHLATLVATPKPRTFWLVVPVITGIALLRRRVASL